MIKGTEKHEKTGKFKATISTLTKGASEFFLGTTHKASEIPVQPTSFTPLPQDILNLIFDYAAPGKTFLPQTRLVNRHLNRATNTFLQSKFNPKSAYIEEQQAEINYLLQYKAEIFKLTKIEAGPGVQFKNPSIKRYFKRLKALSDSPLLFHRREKILNKLNTVILLNKMAEVSAVPLQGIFGQITTTHPAILDCSNCFLTRFPNSVLEKKSLFLDSLWPNLTELHLRGNALKALPKALSVLGNLTVLSLEKNCFSEVPAVVTQLPKLRALLLKNNLLTSIDPALTNKLRQYVHRQLQVISPEDTLKAQKIKQNSSTKVP